MLAPADNWTRDAQGNYVDWTNAPYRQGGNVSLLLEGEDPATLSIETITKRLQEYCSLARRTLKARR